jgi:hypothetical protein
LADCHSGKGKLGAGSLFFFLSNLAKRSCESLFFNQIKIKKAGAG